MQSDAKTIDFMTRCVEIIQDITAGAGALKVLSLAAVRMNGTNQRTLKLVARRGEYFQSGDEFLVLGHTYGLGEGGSIVRRTPWQR